MSTYLIADIGACHDGDMGRMVEACDVAHTVGVNALKFQWTSDPRQMARRRGSAEADGYVEVYAKYLAWPSHRHWDLAAQCRSFGIDYMCTAFLEQDISVVAPHVARFKVASFEASDVRFLAAHAPFGKPVIVSTGMMTEQEISDALFRSNWPDAYHDDGSEGLSPSEKRIREYRDMCIYVLHCVSAYPAPVAQLNLSVLWRSDSEDDERVVFDGLSDHSAPSFTWTGALAVAAGATIVEAHLRLDDTNQKNPDYSHAMTPAQFSDYVKHIRFVETCVGTGDAGQFGPQPCEQPMMAYRVRGQV